MRFKTKTFISTILCILSIYALFMTCIDMCAFQRKFFNYEYGVLNTAEKIGMSKNSLYVATDTLLDYLKDYRDNIDVKVKIHNREREVFDEHEKEHMVDVKNLYQDAMTLRNISLILILILLLLLAYDNKKEIKEVLTYTYQRVFLVFIFFLSALLLYAVSDFTTFWTKFHTIFFSNDLWLLDPDTSVMINMFPEPFFYSLVFLIAGTFFLILILAFLYSIHYQRKLRRAVKVKMGVQEENVLEDFNKNL